MRISDWSSDVCSSDLFGGMAWLMFRNLTGPDGECAAIIHYEEERATSYRHRWATFVQVYDPDRIDTPAVQVGNPNVREGQIFVKWNRRVGTFVRQAHPSDYLAGLDDMDFEDRKSTRLNSSHYCASRMPSPSSKNKNTL